MKELSPRQKALQAHLIKMCHILKKNKFPSDDNRKDYLYMTYGVESTKELSIDQLKEFASYLGYGKKEQSNPKPKEVAKDEPTSATQKQLDTITGIWQKIARDKSDRALREYIYRITKIRPLHLNTLTKSQAQRIITGLMRMQQVAKDEDASDNG